MSIALEMKSISKSFSSNKALDDVNLCVNSGEIVALLGENGAGKSTLMKILCGVWPFGTYDGEVWIIGSGDPKLKLADLKLADFKDTREAHSAGIAMIHQELSVFPELTVAEHLELDRLPHWIAWDELFSRTQQFLDKLGFDLKADVAVKDLSIGNRQLVEIARAIYRDAKILIFDEPTSALTEQEVRRLYQVVDQLKEQGKAILYITHRFDEVFRLADRMVVFRDGRKVAEFSAFQNGHRVQRQELEPELISLMVGRSIQDIYPKRNEIIGEELFHVKNLSVKTAKGKALVHDLSFSLRKGEILGLGGLLGAGRSETFESIFGVLHGSGPRGRKYQVQGEVWIHGKKVDSTTPRDAIAARMAFVSEDRKGSGLVLRQSIQSNMSLPAILAGRHELSNSNRLWSFIYHEKEKEKAGKWTQELRIKSAHLGQAVGELSGGNQQKVVLAKWLMTEPDILFLDEPTRGIDVGAKTEIYQWIQKLASRGLGIVLASSEMPELLGICHRIIVLKEGKYSAEFSAEKTTQEEIMKAASL